MAQHRFTLLENYLTHEIILWLSPSKRKFRLTSRAVPWLKRLVTGLSPQRPGFAPGSIHVGFVVDKVALGRFLSEYFGFPCRYIIPPLLHIHLSPPHEVCDCFDQAAHYHNLSPQLGASLLTRHIGWKQKKKERLTSEL
jgi:hypothetical protein